VPFITEAAWEGLNATVPDRSLARLAKAPPSERLIAAAWPDACDALLDEEAEQAFDLRRDLIDGVRRAKAESGQSASAAPAYFPEPGGQEELIAATFADYGQLAGVTEVHIGEAPDDGEVCASHYVASLGGSVYVPMPQEKVDQERRRIARQIADKKRLLAGAEKKLANTKFTERAPAEVVERQRALAEEARAAIDALQKRAAELG